LTATPSFSATLPAEHTLPPQQWNIKEVLTQNPSRKEIKDAMEISYVDASNCLSRMYPRYGVHSLLQLALLLYDRELCRQWDTHERIDPPAEFKLEDKLTEAELDILEFLRQGLSYPEIASRRSGNARPSRILRTHSRKKQASRDRMMFFMRRGFFYCRIETW
jgi:DNA-binding NarL/FixJ family response regulator